MIKKYWEVSRFIPLLHQRKAITLFQRRSLLPVIIALFVFYIFSSYTLADEKKERGDMKRITYKTLQTELKKVQGKKDEYVKDYIIQGDDLISIVKNSDLEIKIENSIIEGGLDFTELPEVLLSN